MPQREGCTTGTLLACMSIGVLWGTLSLVFHFANQSFDSPSFVILLRTPGTVVLFVVSMTFLSLRNGEARETFRRDFRTGGNYWKFAVTGFLGVAAPGILFMYGLKILDTTTGGVYLSAIPLFAVLLERLPFVKTTCLVATAKLTAILAVAFLGIILVSASSIGLARESEGHCGHKEVKPVADYTAVKKLRNINVNNTVIRQKSCTPFSAKELAGSLLAIMGGSVSYSVYCIFWRSKRENIHYISSGICRYNFGGVFALALFLILHQHDNHEIKWPWSDLKSFFLILILTVIYGWLIHVILDHANKEVGAVVANRAYCLVPIVAWLEDWMFVRGSTMKCSVLYYTMEAVGVVFTVLGLAFFNLELYNIPSTLHTPLLGEVSVQERSETSYPTNVHVFEDSMTSDYHEQWRLKPEQKDPFPPLVKVSNEGH